jgi:hypothetical protein
VTESSDEDQDSAGSEPAQSEENIIHIDSPAQETALYPTIEAYDINDNIVTIQYSNDLDEEVPKINAKIIETVNLNGIVGCEKSAPCGCQSVCTQCACARKPGAFRQGLLESDAAQIFTCRGNCSCDKNCLHRHV